MGALNLMKNECLQSNDVFCAKKSKNDQIDFKLFKLKYINGY